MNWLLISLVFVIVMGAAGLLAHRVGEKQKNRQRALYVMTRDKNFTAGDKQAGGGRADIAKKLKQASDEAVNATKKDKTTIRELIFQAGMTTSLTRYWIYSAMLAAMVWFLLDVGTKWPKIAVLMLTLTAFLGIPKLFLKWRASKRQKKFLEDFPDALDAAVRLLQAGMPITEAIAMAAREFTGPLREEMQRIYDNQKIGLPLGQAALETAKSVPLTEVHMFATALQIQSETGSSLSEVLSNLSAVIRARFRLKRKVQALSSEAKASAAIIACRRVASASSSPGSGPSLSSSSETWRR